MINAGSAAGQSAKLPDEGDGHSRMKRVNGASPLLLAVSLVALAACADFTSQVNPMRVNGRDGGGETVDYAGLMRVGAAAQASGDPATAVGVYRRAAAANSGAAAPLVAAGDALLEMQQNSEAIISYNSALARDPHDPSALRGLARAYLLTGKPALAGQPLATAYEQNPNDPKLLQLIGVADDLVARHEEAQTRYRRGLELVPNDPALSLDLALSLALTGNYPEAVAILRPIAMAPTSSARERQTLALIYGLQGDRQAAEQIARRDLDPASVRRNLAYYESLRQLSVEARHRAILSFGTPPQQSTEQPQ